MPSLMTTSFVSSPTRFSPAPFLANAPDAGHPIRNADRRAIVVQIWPTITKSSRCQVGARLSSREPDLRWCVLLTCPRAPIALSDASSLPVRHGKGSRTVNDITAPDLAVQTRARSVQDHIDELPM